MISYFLGVLLTSISIIGSSNAQSYINLKDLKGEGAVNTIYDGVGVIYITKSSQDDGLLKQIYIQTAVKTITAYDLSQRRLFIGSDMILGWAVDGLTTVTTNVTAQFMNVLKGGLYITSAAQSKDKYFQVYDISQTQQVTLDAGDYTLVFLNALYGIYPSTPTTFQNWSQPSDKSVYIYDGIPQDAKEDIDTQVFSNPMTNGHENIFFPTVEDFSITSTPFYMKVSGKGQALFTFTTKPNYLDINHAVTKNPTTTGLFMKSRTEVPTVVTIEPRFDPNFVSVTGANCIASIPASNGTVYVTSFGLGGVQPEATAFHSSNRTVSWSIPLVQNVLQFSSENVDGGQFYIQYYFIKGTAPIIFNSTTGQPGGQTTTQQTPTTTQRLRTTTKSVGTLQFVIITVYCMIFWLW